MSPLTQPTRLTLRRTWRPMDPDAAAYITAVETADGQALEERVKIAIDNFVLGCKADGIWNAIKASCILAGARTLAGALTPLVGPAPTNFNFVSGDYNRRTGLVGDGSTKYLDSNRNNNADPQNNNHIAVVVTSATGTGPGVYPRYIGADGPVAGCTEIARTNTAANDLQLFSRGSATSSQFVTATGAASATGLIGVARSQASSFVYRISGNNNTALFNSQTPSSAIFGVFRSSGASASITYSSGRLAFYSIGEALDLALLDARVTALINAIGAAIP